MRKNLALAVIVLSCIAAQPARADVIITGDDTILIDGKRFSDRDEKDDNRNIYRRNGNYIGRGLNGRNDNILIYNGNSSRHGGDMYVIENGKFIRTPDGIYDLGDGEFVDHRGSYTGKIGGVDVHGRDSGFNGKVGDVEIRN